MLTSNVLHCIIIACKTFVVPTIFFQLLTIGIVMLILRTIVVCSVLALFTTLLFLQICLSRVYVV